MDAKQESSGEIYSADRSLEYIFHPNSIAVVGVSAGNSFFNAGLRYIQILAWAGFKGSLFGINPQGSEVPGFKIYTNVKEIPEDVDYVISAIPVKFTPELMRDCVVKGVKVIQFFTSGFGEIEDVRGKQIEEEILGIAHGSSLRIIGPNCLGLYCSETGLSFSPEFPQRSGDFAFMGQSGGNSVHCVTEAANREIYFSKVISFGNAIDLNESDFLYYLANDPKTKVIGVYLEGVKDGKSFAGVLREATLKKPVIVLKSGSTDAGIRAAASHTSAIAGSNAIWQSMLNQVNAIQVSSIGELVDVASIFLQVPPIAGRRTLVVGLGGGASVVAADDCTRAGLIVPSLPSKSRLELENICGSEIGGSFRNPIDLYRVDLLQQVVEKAYSKNEFDILLAHMPFELYGLVTDDLKDVVVKMFCQSLINLRGSEYSPHVVVLHGYSTAKARQRAMEAHAMLCEAGFAVFETVERAARAINKVIQYYRQP